MKNLIDYASQDNGTDFRDALYSAIHDKVAAHIEAKKQEIASGLMGQQFEEEYELTEEEYEQLDELSKGTLRRYTKKAISDLGTTKAAMHDNNRNVGTGTPSLDGKGYMTAYHQAKVRTNGINTASKKIKEEYESLDEISTDLVNKYTDKAQKSYASSDTSPEKKANRRTGLMTGYRKLKATAKVPATYGEEVEMEESTDWSAYNAKVSARKVASPEELHAEFKKHANNPGHPNFKGKFSDDSATGGKTAEQKAIGNIAIGTGKADKHNYAAKIAHFVNP